MCHLSNSVFNDNVVIIVVVVIDTVFNEIAVYVSLSFNRPPFITNISCNVYNLKRRKETIFNTFLQAICVNRLTKITDAGLVLCFLWRGSHTQLNCTIKVFQNFTPVAIIFGTSTMALVNDNHIKEPRLKQFLIVLFPFFPNQLLVK